MKIEEMILNRLPSLPIKLEHYGAILAYIGFFLGMVSLLANSVEGKAFSFGCIIMGIGEMVRRPRWSYDFVDKQGRPFRDEYYGKNPISGFGWVLSFFGVVLIGFSIFSLIANNTQ